MTGEITTSEKTAAAQAEEHVDKGKGKAIEQIDSESEDDGSSDEEMEDADQSDEEENDDLADIDTNNIIAGGGRTRGKRIEFKDVADLPDDDEDDDGDFVEPQCEHEKMNTD